jgi:RNA polymerase sigma factor (sigma-70 family)
MITLQTWQKPVTKETEENQYTKIVKNWTPHLQYTAWQITKNKQVSEDIVQEAFLVLWKQQARIIPGNPVGWLIKVVTNLSAKYIKQKNIQIRIHNTLREGEITSYFDVEEYLLVKEKRVLLNETFQQLPSQQKIVLHLSKNIGMRREEIAACLQLSPNTVKVHLQRAMQFMKEHLTCIVIISMLFVCNNIFSKGSNTKVELRELYSTSSVSLNETTQVTTILLKQ